MVIHRGHAFGAGAVIAGVAVVAVVALVPIRRIAPEHHLQPTARLSDTARAALKTQMHTHARRMMELVSDVTLIDFDNTAAAAQRILEEPRVARPLTGDATELNATLPARFFTLQDELRDHLQSLRQAALARDADRLADAFAETTRTCVRCHDALQGGATR